MPDGTDGREDGGGENDPIAVIEQMRGHLFVLESMLVHLVWAWARGQDHPPSALANYLRPIEEGMAAMAANPDLRSAAMRHARDALSEIAAELEATLHREVLRRTEAGGRNQ